MTRRVTGSSWSAGSFPGFSTGSPASQYPESWGPVILAVDQGVTVTAQREDNEITRALEAQMQPAHLPGTAIPTSLTCSHRGPVAVSNTPAHLHLESRVRFLFFLLISLIGSFPDIIENSENTEKKWEREHFNSLTTLPPRNNTLQTF